MEPRTLSLDLQGYLGRSFCFESGRSYEGENRPPSRTENLMKEDGTEIDLDSLLEIELLRIFT